MVIQRPPNDTLGHKFQNTIADAFIYVFSILTDPIIEAGSLIFHNFLTSIANSLVINFKSVTDEIYNSPIIDDKLKNIIRTSIASGQQASQTTGIIISIYTFIGLFLGQISIASELGRQKANTTIHPELLSPETYVTAKLRREFSENQLRDRLLRLGLSSEDVKVVFDTVRPILSPETEATAAVQGAKEYLQAVNDAIRWGITPEEFETLYKIAGEPISPTDIFELWNRHEIDETKVNDAIKESRLKPKYTDDLKKLRYRIPPSNDLIRMLVRDVFKEDVVSKYGYDSEFDNVGEDLLGQTGIAPEWARRYWRAHWELPSITQVAEMVHRGIVNISDLEDLLRIQDIAPFWRDKIISVLYNPFTRVDIRRMFRVGTIKAEELQQAYKDIGYDDTKAIKLAEFTIQEYGKENKELTKSEILNFLEDSIISEKDANEKLTALGYSSDEVIYFITSTNLKRERKILNDSTKAIQVKYIDGLIDSQTATSNLSQIGYDADSIKGKLELWDATKQSKIQHPSESVLSNWYYEDVISIDEFHNELVKAGWIEPYITNFIKFVSNIKTDKQRDALEKKLKEQERLLLSNQKNTYRLKIAEHDIAIAEFKASIAEAELGIFLTSEIDIKDTLAEQIKKQKVEIANLQVLKAKLVPEFITGES